MIVISGHGGSHKKDSNIPVINQVIIQVINKVMTLIFYCINPNCFIMPDKFIADVTTQILHLKQPMKNSTFFPVLTIQKQSSFLYKDKEIRRPAEEFPWGNMFRKINFKLVYIICIQCSRSSVHFNYPPLFFV